ncbi:MAG: type II toxin-antitoxin system VapC family toxin [Actinomycetales bacterium]|nr:type II toxin-antitoxin system VapC family toxin [Actinomycetales bacterium]
MVGDVVLDASAMVELFVDEDARAGAIARRLQEFDRWVVPPIFDLECMAALRRTSGAAPSRALLLGLPQVLDQAPIERVPTHPLNPRIAELLGSVTAFDASYVVLAEALDLPLLTCDARLTSAAGPRCSFELL